MKLILFPTILILFVFNLSAKEYHVAKNGNDQNSGKLQILLYLPFRLRQNWHTRAM